MCGWSPSPPGMSACSARFLPSATQTQTFALKHLFPLNWPGVTFYIQSMGGRTQAFRGAQKNVRSCPAVGENPRLITVHP